MENLSSLNSQHIFCMKADSPMQGNSLSKLHLQRYLSQFRYGASYKSRYQTLLP